MRDITSNGASPFFFVNQKNNFKPHQLQQIIYITVVNISMVIIQLPQTFLSSFLCVEV